MRRAFLTILVVTTLCPILFAGQFLQPDPGYDYETQDPMSWNLYAYVRRNPIKLKDPTGMYGSPGAESQYLTYPVFEQDVERYGHEEAIQMRKDGLVWTAKNAPLVWGVGAAMASGSVVALTKEAVEEATGVPLDAGSLFSPKTWRKAGGMLSEALGSGKTLSEGTEELAGGLVKAIGKGTDVPNATGQITSEVLDDSTVFYRAFGGDSGPVGQFMSPLKPSSSNEAIATLALPPSNTASSLATLRVQGGVRFQRSTAAAAFGQPGGGQQIQLLEPAKISIISIESLK